MTESIETSEREGVPYAGAHTVPVSHVDLIARAVRLLREDAELLAEGATIDGAPDWENESEAKEAHDERLLVARELELLAPAAVAALRSHP